MAESTGNAMTVDVEDWFQVSALAKSIDPAAWDRFVPRVEANTDRLLSLFDDHGVTGTFFVLGWIARRHPQLVRRIADSGHEIACHGWSHQLVYHQARDVFRDETVRAKGLLEDLSGQPVRGYRAASYSITRESLWALDILAEAGFDYDSSIFPVRHDRYGIPNGQRWPHLLETPGGHTLVEFPLTTVRMAGSSLPMAGGGYFRLYPYAVTRAGLRSVVKDGRPAIFYLHPWEIDPLQPRVKTSWLSRFRHYNNLRRCEPRLERLLSDFSWTTCEKVLHTLQLLEQYEGRPGARAGSRGEGPDPSSVYA